MQVDNNIMFENKQNIRILCVEKLLIWVLELRDVNK